MYIICYDTICGRPCICGRLNLVATKLRHYSTDEDFCSGYDMLQIMIESMIYHLLNQNNISTYIVSR